MFEVEMKFRLAQPEPYEAKVRELFQAEFGEPRLEEDLYFQRLSRDFRETNEALRIRRIGEELKITYKGPRRDPVVKTREEIELPLRLTGDSDGADSRKEAWIRLLTRLGYEPFAEVRKLRRTASFLFGGRAVTATRDSLDELGEFTEIEILASSRDELSAAQVDLKALAVTLGLTELVIPSYLTLLLDKQGRE